MARVYSLRENLTEKDAEIMQGKKDLQDALSDTKIANDQLDEYMVTFAP